MQGTGIFSETTLRQARQAGASPAVVSAVRQASQSTGVDFSYLMEKAAVESNYDPSAKAATSSATGLYQFTDSTWLDMIAQHGGAHGLGAQAALITVGADGTPMVADAAQRQKILDLRKDPQVAAQMAAELAKDNKTELQASVGGRIGGTELYLAHFLGAGGAAKFLNALHQDSGQPASAVLPEAAASNPGVFTDQATGKPCTLEQVYDRFAAHFGGSNFLAGSNQNCNLAAAQGGLSGWRSGEDLTDRAVPGVGGPTLSLYAILTLASLDVPTKAGDQAIRGKNDPFQGGKTLAGL
jgi:hypothetical protein